MGLQGHVIFGKSLMDSRSPAHSDEPCDERRHVASSWQHESGAPQIREPVESKSETLQATSTYL